MKTETASAPTTETTRAPRLDRVRLTAQAEDSGSPFTVLEYRHAWGPVSHGFPLVKEYRRKGSVPTVVLTPAGRAALQDGGK